MKNTHTYAISFSLIIIIIIALLSFSCNNDMIVDANFPEPLIYLPLASTGILDISEPDTSETPQFFLNPEGSKLIIPVGVYRSGLTNLSNATIDILANTDTLLSMGFDLSLILPQDKSIFPESIEMANGSELAIFEVEIDRQYLIDTDLEEVVFALTVNSAQVESNEELNTLVIRIKPDVFEN
ncbi:hypothetical protein [Algoriphagus antarcticus]|nr:hypothetical protein [Algoriphagus antarcticus]